MAQLPVVTAWAANGREPQVISMTNRSPFPATLRRLSCPWAWYHTPKLEFNKHREIESVLYLSKIGRETWDQRAKGPGVAT